jgi:hypothetical protein
MDSEECAHVWRRPKKMELSRDEFVVVCRLCNLQRMLPTQMHRLFDLFYPECPGDDE